MKVFEQANMIEICFSIIHKYLIPRGVVIIEQPLVIKWLTRSAPKVPHLLYMEQCRLIKNRRKAGTDCRTRHRDLLLTIAFQGLRPSCSAVDTKGRNRDRRRFAATKFCFIFWHGEMLQESMVRRALFIRACVMLPILPERGCQTSSESAWSTAV